MSISRVSICTVAAVGTVSGLLAAPASAQERAGALEEVVVTATKRAETLQDVPISVGVVTGETVEKFNLMGFEDLQNFVPNLLVHETLGSYQIRIRGLGSGAAQLSFVSAVGSFVDGVYCGRPRCFQEPMFDIERVEVVRGPQGALFGKNTIAGAVSVTSALPTDEFVGRVTAGTELAEGGFNVSGYLSGPLSDTVSARLAVKRDSLDGFVRNLYTGKDDAAQDSTLVRGTLQWKPTDTFDLVAKVERAKREYDGYTVQLIGYGGYGTRYFPAGEFPVGDPRNGALIPFSQPEKIDQFSNVRSIFPEGQFDDTNSTNYALTMNLDIGGYTLTSITGVAKYDFLRRSSATGSTEIFVDTEIGEDYEQRSQEFRLTSPKGEFFDFVAGVFYSEDESYIAQWSPFKIPSSPTYSSGIRSYNGESESKSAYLSGTFHLANDRARAIVGIRYGEDTTKGNSRLVNGTYDPVANKFTPLPTDFVYIPPGASNREFNVFSTRKEDYADPSLNLQFDATDDAMVYASWAKGFKAGGFLANDGTVGNNIISEVTRTTTGGVSSWAQKYVGTNTVTDAQMLAGITLGQDNGIYDFKPEKATSYELGAKMKFADGRVRWNVALFNTKFEDLQTSQYDGVRFITRNAAEATSKGLESELDWAINENLTLSWNAAYVSAKYDEYKNTFCKVIALNGTQANPTCVNGQGDLSGETLDRAPKFETTLSLEWESPLTQNTLLRVNGSGYHSADYYIQANVSPLYRQPSFQKYDLRVAVADNDDKWEVALVGRNLTNELTIQHAFLVGRYSAASISTPRYVTLQGTWKF